MDAAHTKATLDNLMVEYVSDVLLLRLMTNLKNIYFDFLSSFCKLPTVNQPCTDYLMTVTPVTTSSSDGEVAQVVARSSLNR